MTKMHDSAAHPSLENAIFRPSGDQVGETSSAGAPSSTRVSSFVRLCSCAPSTSTTQMSGNSPIAATLNASRRPSGVQAGSSGPPSNSGCAGRSSGRACVPSGRMSWSAPFRSYAMSSSTGGSASPAQPVARAMPTSAAPARAQIRVAKTHATIRGREEAEAERRNRDVTANTNTCSTLARCGSSTETRHASRR